MMTEMSTLLRTSIGCWQVLLPSSSLDVLMRELSHQLGWCLMCCQPGHWATNCPNLSLSLANTPPRPTSPVPRMGAGGSVEGTVKEERQRGKRRGVEPLPLMPKEGAESLLLFQPLDQAQGLEGDEVSTAGGIDHGRLIPTCTDGGSSER